MISLYLNYLLGGVLLLLLVGQLVKKPFKKWNTKRMQAKVKAQQLAKLNKNQIKLIKEITSVSEFFNWVDDKVFVNAKQKKQFYKEFHQKKYRQEWFSQLIKQLESKAKAVEVQLKGKDAIKKPKVEKKNDNK